MLKGSVARKSPLPVPNVDVDDLAAVTYPTWLPAVLVFRDVSGSL